MQKLLQDQLKQSWQRVAQQDLTAEEFNAEQELLLSEYRNIWRNALCLEAHQALEVSTLSELGLFAGCEDLAEIKLRCQSAVATLTNEWREKVPALDRQSVEEFYDKSQATIYELMWWHTLCEDSSPLAYVTALHFAQQTGCRSLLDFGAGVGSGGVLFARNGLEVTLADISSCLQQFSRWRFEKRMLSAQLIDLKASGLPSRSFDMVTAMDVFEHLVDPVETVDQLSDALKPGGFLFARLSAEIDEDRPQHIVQDFGPTFERLQKLGFTKVWEDDWLWGHVVFKKP